MSLDSPCALCELRCGADRRAGERGPCGVAASSRVFRCYVSMAEELDLSPALMVYLGGCNFRCRFCTQAPRCFEADWGIELLSPEMIGWIDAAAPGVRWINWVGGEPSLHAPALIEVRGRLRTDTPWLLNTNGSFTRECRELLDGLFELYVVDLKFGTEACAASLAGVPGYLPVLHRNLREICDTGPQRLLVRHLLIPGHERCCFEPTARWVSANLPGVRFHLMSSYVPGPLAMQDPALGRTVPAAEVARAEEYCRSLGLKLVEKAAPAGGCMQSSTSPASPYKGGEDVQVSIGPDGRLYFHDLDADLIDVALAVNPDDALMRRRQDLCRPRCEPTQEESR